MSVKKKKKEEEENNNIFFKECRILIAREKILNNCKIKIFSTKDLKLEPKSESELEIET